MTQAIFAPFTVFKALGATAGLIGEIPTAVQRLQRLVKAGIFGGTYCATYDFLRDAIDGKIPNCQEVIDSYKNGFLFSSYLHVAGEAITDASPFIKNAYDKATSELSDNMKALKYAWDNVEVPKDIKLSTNGGNIDFDAGKDFVKKYNEGLEKIKNGNEWAADAKYTTKIKWGINDIEARPFGKGFFGKRLPQNDTRVDDFELKINPNNESFYLPHPNGGYVQFENLAGDIVQDGKLIIKQKSFYHVEDLPQFAQNKVIQEAMRQIDSAKAAGYKVEWLVSEEKAVDQLTRLFERENIDITVRYYPE